MRPYNVSKPRGMKSPALILVCLLTLFGMPNAQAQWLEWDVQTESRMELFTVATSDGF